MTADRPVERLADLVCGLCKLSEKKEESLAAV